MEIKKYWEHLKKIVSENPKGKPLDPQGRFYPDPTPIAPPVGFTPDIDMFERMRNIVRQEMSQAALNAGMETFEEADDFDVDDDYEPFSPYEMIVEQARPDAPIIQPDPDQAHPPEGPLPPQPSPVDEDPPSDGPVPPAAPDVRPVRKQGPRPGSAKQA